jgi:hypothetical protein
VCRTSRASGCEDAAADGVSEEASAREDVRAEAGVVGTLKTSRYQSCAFRGSQP